MANKKLDKYDLLVDVIEAIYNDNEDAKIETTNLNANAAGRGSWLIEDTPQIPTKRGGIKTGTFSQNRLNAESVYIGETLIRRVHLEPVPLKGKFSEFALDTGHKYVLRSPKGEAEFTQNDEDFILVWGAILSKADIHSKPGSSEYNRKILSIMHLLYNHIKNEKLKKAAGQGCTQLDTKTTKFDKAVAKLKKLGVEVTEEKLKKRLSKIQKQGIEK